MNAKKLLGKQSAGEWKPFDNSAKTGRRVLMGYS